MDKKFFTYIILYFVKLKYISDKKFYFMKNIDGKIGNIITSGSGKKHPKIFNIAKTMGDIDTSLPTLIIGLQEAKAILGRNFSIIDRRINDRIWWTYKKIERNYEYETDMVDFYRHCLLTMLGNIDYKYINFPTYSYTKLKSLIKYIKNQKNKTCFITRDRNFIFIYIKEDNVVLGLSLTLLEYCGISKDKSVRKIKSNKNNHFIKDLSFIDGTLREVIGNDTHYIPVLSELFSTQ